MNVKSLVKKGLGVAGRHKVAIGVGAAALGLGGIALGAKKLLSRGAHHGRSSVSRLKSQVMRLTLKIKKKQLQRKLFKEEVKF